MRVLYYRAAPAPHAHSPSVVRVVGLVHRHVAILHQRQQCRQLEGRAGLHAAAQGVVLLLDIDAAALRRLPQIGHGQNVARGHLHHHRRAPDGLLRRKLTPQSLIGYVLDVGIERGHDIHAILGVDILAAVHDAREARRYALADHTSVAPFQLLAVDRLDTVISLVAHKSQRTPRQLPVWIDPLVERHQIVCHTHVPVQDGVLAQRLPLVVVDRARQDRHGAVVAQRVVQFHRLELIMPQHVPYTGEETLRAQHRGILAVDNAVVFVVLLDHAAAILRGRAVPEEPRQKLGQRVGLLAEQSQRVESVAGHVEVDAVAQDRRGQRLAVTRQNRPAARIDRVDDEDTAFETLGIVCRFGTEGRHPYQTHNHKQRHENEDSVDPLHPRVHLVLDIGIAFQFCHFSVPVFRPDPYRPALLSPLSSA